MIMLSSFVLSFFFNDTATTKIYTLSLHAALPISPQEKRRRARGRGAQGGGGGEPDGLRPPEGRVRRPHRASRIDRKSTRLNSSHANISYAVFCLKKKRRRTSRWRRSPLPVRRARW